MVGLLAKRAHRDHRFHPNYRKQLRPPIVAAFVMLLYVVLTSPAHADIGADSHVTLYPGQGVRTNLVQLPQRLVDGSLTYEESYFTGLGYRHGTETPSWIERTFEFIGVHGISTGIEVVGIKHTGMQNHYEATLSYTLKSPPMHLGPVRARFGFSSGVSHALGTPWFERGPAGDPDKRFQTLIYLAHEFEWGLRGYEQVSLVTRVHHRSGGFGTVAPRGVGSNFLTAGVRVHW
jgi:hypothetical protein